MTTEAITLTAPAIGQHWPEAGGTYAGLMRGRQGQPDYHLIVAPEASELQDVEWGNYGKKIEGADSYHDGWPNTTAMLAAGLPLAITITALNIDGHADWYLPSQAEAHLMAANLFGDMPKEWYWTSTQYSATSAWIQGFSYGSQGIDYKDWKGRARAVRQIRVNP